MSGRITTNLRNMLSYGSISEVVGHHSKGYTVEVFATAKSETESALRTSKPENQGSRRQLHVVEDVLQ